ncbi:MAG: hypothetical protein WD042_16000 [Phycisphaeraceae bacterium]
MTPRLLDIARDANDANLGQTLLRLARLAETAHRYEAAMTAHQLPSTVSTGANGLCPRPEVRPSRFPNASVAGSVHTEVDR